MSAANMALPALRRMYLELSDAYALTDEELLSIPNFGKKSLEWVRAQQAEAGVAPTTRRLIHIHTPVFRILRELGLTPEHVKEMKISQREVEVTLYKINENGKKYLDKETGEAATEQQTFEVITSNQPLPEHPFDFLDERSNW